MEKNIAALMREDTKTVRVNFDTSVMPNSHSLERTHPMEGSTKHYTYVTELDLHVGDLVVVEASGRVAAATVVGVDDDVDIEPNANIYYKWVIAKVDLDGYIANGEKNKIITDAVAVAYKNNLRRSFAQQVLAGMEGEQRDRIMKLTAVKKGRK